MIQDLTRTVNFLAENQITIKQYLLLVCLFLDKLDEKENGRWYRQKAGKNRPMANLYRYSKQVESWTFEEADDLVEKGLLITKDDRTQRMKEGFFPDNMFITEKAIDLIFATRSDFEEFWDLYPAFVPNFQDPINGRAIPLKLVSKDEVESLYKSKVKSRMDHSLLMSVLRWAIEQDQINMRIDKFLESKHWESLEELMDADFGSEVRGHTI